ncbi:hypothetical protein [Halorussus lipolyticus]|uniref:hypothetical protein n=1 Tax=Halorussus lipolyticus TaxID=3034024 RepID=UPI0023E85C90|nr:hypothetical protein [Halorussus sp. DT80]
MNRRLLIKGAGTGLLASTSGCLSRVFDNRIVTSINGAGIYYDSNQFFLIVSVSSEQRETEVNLRWEMETYGDSPIYAVEQGFLVSKGNNEVAMKMEANGMGMEDIRNSRVKIVRDGKQDSDWIQPDSSE